MDHEEARLLVLECIAKHFCFCYGKLKNSNFSPYYNQRYDAFFFDYNWIILQGDVSDPIALIEQIYGYLRSTGITQDQIAILVSELYQNEWKGNHYQAESKDIERRNTKLIRTEMPISSRSNNTIMKREMYKEGLVTSIAFGYLREKLPNAKFTETVSIF